MSWNLLAYAIPAERAMGVYELLHPERYPKFLDFAFHTYEMAEESHYAPHVREIAERILTAENHVDAPYYKRLQGLLQEGLEIKTLVATHLKVVAVEDGAFPIRSLGTDRKYYISISPTVPLGYSLGNFRRAHAWFAAREIYHFLEKGTVKSFKWQTIGSLIAAFATTFFLGWGLCASLGVTFISSLLAHVIVSRRAEAKADDFANRHCTPEERTQALIHFLGQERKKVSFLVRVFHALSYPSVASRIKEIKNSRMGGEEPQEISEINMLD